MRSALLIFVALGLLGAEPDPAAIVRRSVSVNDADFEALPEYSHLETDFYGASSKTYDVLMIDGSPYQERVALNGSPLSAADRRREQDKLAAVTRRRQRQSAADRAARIAKYQRERQSEHLLMNEMVHAFSFQLVGEDKIDGRPAYVLQATPRPGYQPPNQKARVLTGMRGKLWIDKAGYHWVKVEAEVIHPVNFGFFIAKVGRGTRFELDQAPVSPNVWEPKHFSEHVSAKILGIKSYHSQDVENYTDYRR